MDVDLLERLIGESMTTHLRARAFWTSNGVRVRELARAVAVDVSEGLARAEVDGC